tara:strand:- start:479 stop:1177 length:699 start_codon:yes stop_codon:yes gene_type:complete
MKTKREQNFKRNSQDGNALLYVLIAIVLFAGLGFTLARQSHNQGVSELDDARAELYADQLIAYAAQAQNSIDQMLFSGSEIADLDFTLPSEAGFNTAPYHNKVYHPTGGGLIPSSLNDSMKKEASPTPPASWYLGRFNNVEWSDSTNPDVMLSAYQITREICEKINIKITGSDTIPAVTVQPRTLFVDDSNYSGSNEDLTVARCPDCENYKVLCVSNPGVNIFTFYAVLADE